MAHPGRKHIHSLQLMRATLLESRINFLSRLKEDLYSQPKKVALRRKLEFSILFEQTDGCTTSSFPCHVEDINAVDHE